MPESVRPSFRPSLDVATMRNAPLLLEGAGRVTVTVFAPPEVDSLQATALSCVQVFLLKAILTVASGFTRLTRTLKVPPALTMRESSSEPPVESTFMPIAVPGGYAAAGTTKAAEARVAMTEIFLERVMGRTIATAYLNVYHRAAVS